MHRNGLLFISPTGAGTQAATEESLLDQSQPLIQYRFGRGMPVLVRHFVELYSRGSEFASQISGFADAYNVRDMVATAFLDVKVEIRLARRVHDEEA